MHDVTNRTRFTRRAIAAVNHRMNWARTWSFAIALLCLSASQLVSGANGSVAYTYDALGRVITASYDTGVIIIYTYDANGNRTAQTINVNALPLCLGTSAHGNPTTWGAGLWASAASGC